jgi:hypothetical protein
VLPDATRLPVLSAGESRQSNQSLRGRNRGKTEAASPEAILPSAEIVKLNALQDSSFVPLQCCMLHFNQGSDFSGRRHAPLLH